MLKDIDHIALAVPDLDQAMSLYRDCFGVDFYFRETNQEQGFEAAGFQLGEAHIELLAPTRDDSLIQRFLEKRGPGIHHIAYTVSELDKRLKALREKGLRTTTDEPTRGTGGTRIAFIHPKDLLGALVELVEVPEEGVHTTEK